MTNETIDHQRALAKAAGKTTHQARAYVDLHNKLFNQGAELARVREKFDRILNEVVALRFEVDTLRATALPQIDPDMIPAGCALPPFDGVEEAQMAAKRAVTRG